MTLSLNKRLWISLGILSLIITITLLIIYIFLDIFIYFIISILFVYLLNPLVKRLEDRGLNSNSAIAIVFIGVFIIIIISFILLIPLIIKQLSIISHIYSFKIHKNIPVIKDLTSNINVIKRSTELFIEHLKVLLYNSFTKIIAFFIFVPIITFILLKDGNKIKRSLFSLIPNKYFEITVAIIEGINKSFRNFTYAKSIQSLIVASITAVLFLIFGVPASVFLGILCGILNIIPYIGPIISMVIVGLISYINHGFNLFIISELIIIFAQLIDNIITQPFITPKLMHNHPLTVLIITLIGAKLMGPIGLVLGILFFSVIKVIYISVYKGLRIIYERSS